MDILSHLQVPSCGRLLVLGGVVRALRLLAICQHGTVWDGTPLGSRGTICACRPPPLQPRLGVRAAPRGSSSEHPFLKRGSLHSPTNRSQAGSDAVPPGTK